MREPGPVPLGDALPSKSGPVHCLVLPGCGNALTGELVMETGAAQAARFRGGWPPGVACRRFRNSSEFEETRAGMRSCYGGSVVSRWASH